MPESTPLSSTPAAGSKKKPPAKLVREVTDKVYALWLRDLALEKERKRFS
ncbi:MAG: hypothetical protein M5U34_05910 [Chloroflexi bacterium]|nr:hypothetical protein [Chloroflexota bacterium]